MGRRTVGRIYTRNGSYWLDYSSGGHTDKETGERHRGKRRRVSLARDADGKPITNRKAAAARAAEILRPFSAGTDADRRREAAAALAAAEDAAAAAVALADRLALADVWERYPLAYTTRRGTRRPLKPKTVEAHKTYWEAFRKWFTAARPTAAYMEDVTAADAKAYMAHLLAAGMHPRTVTYHRDSLNALWRHAGRRSPWAAVDRFTAPVESRRHLEDEELRKVCTAADGELRRLLAVGLYTGLRLGDAVALEWADVRGGWVHRRTAKRGVQVSFPVHPELAAVLADVPQAEQHGAVCPDLLALYGKDSSAVSKRIAAHFAAHGIACSDRYEHTPSDNPAKGKTRAGSGKRGGKAGEEEEQPKGRKVARVGFHSLRHSFATICAKASIPLGAVAAWLGHTPSVDRIYQHFGSKDSERIVAALPAGMFQAAAPKALPPPAEESAADARAALADFAAKGAIETVRTALALFR